MSKILANQIANYGDDAPIEIKEGLNIPAGKPIQAAGSAGSAGQVLSTTGTSIAWVATFDGDYNSLSNKPTIPAAQVNADWNATSGVGVILNKPVVPQQPSVTTAAAGTAALSYNSTNGEFTFTPPDLSGYATETWVNGRGYLTSYTETDTLDSVTGRGATTTNALTVGGVSIGDDDGTKAKSLKLGADDDLTLYYDGRLGYVTSYIESDQMIIRPKTTPSDTYIDMIEGGPVRLYHGSNTRLSTSATGVGISGDLDVTGKIFYSNNFADLTALNAVNAGTYHGMFAHVHAEGHGYFAHAGAWTQLLDTGSSISELADVNLAVAPQSGQVLAYDGSNWVATAAGGGGGGIALTDLSVSTASAGTAALTYNNVSGVFTYTPPDLSSYAQTANLSIANWDAAYGWGNHASAGYLSSYTETDTLDSVTGRGSSTTNNVSFGNIDSPQGTIKAGNQIGGVFTGSTITADGRLTIINRIAGGNLIYAGYFFNSIQNTFVVDSNANLTLSGSLTAGGEIKTERFGTPVALGADSSNAAIRIGTSVSPPFRVDYSGNIVASGSLTAGGLTYPTSNGNSGDVLTSNGSGSVTWAAPTGGGANVTISDTIPAGTPTAGDLWWESDTGRLKVYYTDTDSSQWVDASPPLTQDRIASSSAPSSASDTGTPGDIRYDSGYVYICISNNTWKRAALATW